MSRKKLVVIGGGAAGFFCAVNAARMHRDLEVIILEKSSKLLSKVRVSGGGRCNVTHACFDIEEMSRRYPRGKNFVKKTFHQFFTTDTIQWFEERGVKLKTEADGRMFPVTDSSQTIIDCLLKEANKFGIQIYFNAEVKNLQHKDGRFLFDLSDLRPQTSDFRPQTSDLRPLTSDFVCIACGGYPKTEMFDWLIRTGHQVEKPVPSLFSFNMPLNPIVKLTGISVENAKVKIAGTKSEQEGPLLVTHWGISGPAVLKLSAWAARELAERKYDFIASINWIPAFNEQTLRQEFQSLRASSATQNIGNRNSFHLPQRLWEFLLEQSGINGRTKWSDLPAKSQNQLIKNLLAFESAVKGKTTFKEEFVTAGGIRLSEVDANTMMSKKIPNLFFAGEVLDVDGITGGYNFQHAWTSGWIAANKMKGYCE